MKTKEIAATVLGIFAAAVCASIPILFEQPTIFRQLAVVISFAEAAICLWYLVAKNIIE
jgi:hypothetical protein